MSKYVKYISSSHYGAPVMLGDRWGYCVEMLRTVLCTGFNERTDVSEIEIISENTFSVTFLTPHNYVKNQTIKLSDMYVPELNGEAVVLSSNSTTIVCQSYNDLSGILNTKYENLSDIKTIVAPLGFIEKFSDGYRSAFTTDEEEAFLYIDDTKPDVTPNNIFTPIVAMTDKMTDIDTFGKNIVPYDSNHPEWFKTRGYKDSNRDRNGIWNWITYSGLAQSQTPVEYVVIGNGRMFYFMPKIISGSIVNRNTYGFGKISNKANDGDLLYCLFATSGRSNDSVYNGNRLHPNSAVPISNVERQEYALYTDIGLTSRGILRINNKSHNILFSPYMIVDDNAVNVSGNYSSIAYPDIYTNKYIISPIYLFVEKNLICKLSGYLWVYNPPNEIIVKDGDIIKYKQNNRDKNLFFINAYYSSVRNNEGSSASTKYIYNISLDYKDWFNYE